MIEWTRAWVDAADYRNTGIDIHFTAHEDLRTDDESFFKGILEVYEIPLEKFNFKLIAISDQRLHRRKDKLDEWRSVFSPEQERAANAMIPDDLAARFDWKM